MSFSYCLPNLSVERNFKAVGPADIRHVNSGGLYLPFPLKTTKLFGFSETDPGVSLFRSPVTVHIPCTLFHPLLNPGSTRLISSPNVGPFSVSQSLPVRGSKSIPKLF